MADIIGLINGTQGSAHTFGIEWEETNLSIQNNMSNARARVFLKKNSGGGSYSGVAEPGTLSINGNVFNFTSIYDTRNTTSRIYLTSWKTVSNIIHNTDGSKSINISATYNANNSPYLTTANANANVALTKINRVSVIGNIPSFVVEDNITIPITKYVSSYTDNLTISFGNTVIATVSDINNGDIFQFDQNQLDQLYSLTNNVQTINSTSTFNLTFAISTYNDSTLIGTNTKTVQSMIINADPILNSFTYQDVNINTLNFTDNNQQAIQGLSIIQVIGNYILQKGATFSSYQIALGNQIVNSDTIIPNNINSNLIVQIKDSRGNLSNEISMPIKIFEYKPPQISDFSLYKPDPTNDQIFLKLNGTYSAVENDAGALNVITSITYIYRELGIEQWSSNYLTFIQSGDGIINIDNLVDNFDNTLNWEFQIIIGDLFVILNPLTQFIYKSSPDFEVINGGTNTNGTMNLNGEDITTLFPKGIVQELIWSGSASAGAIITPIKPFKDYKFLIVQMNGQGTWITCPTGSNQSYIRGIGGYCTSATIYTYQIGIDVNANGTGTIIGIKSLSHLASGTHSAYTDQTIIGIHGVK